ncbi:MAG: peptidoglycan-binding protein [Acidobacteria bacterium]|nr:peptidoglycan-binding protein [Acidobacteriota bacterium]
MRRLLALIALGAFLSGGLAHAAPAKKPASKKVLKKKVLKKTAAGRRGAARGKKAASWRNRQVAPTPDRYRQIQEALASRGYLKKAPTGAWDQDSIDALRRFQQDQSLSATGKIDSMSLIALGLGPPRETASAIPAPAPPAP